MCGGVLRCYSRPKTRIYTYMYIHLHTKTTHLRPLRQRDEPGPPCVLLLEVLEEGGAALHDDRDEARLVVCERGKEVVAWGKGGMLVSRAHSN